MGWNIFFLEVILLFKKNGTWYQIMLKAYVPTCIMACGTACLVNGLLPLCSNSSISATLTIKSVTWIYENCMRIHDLFFFPPSCKKNESRNSHVHHQCDRLAAGFQSKNCCDGAGFSGRTWCKDVYVVVQHGFTSLVSLVLVVIYPARWKIHFWTWPGPSVSGGHLLPGIGTTFFVAFLSVNSLRDRMIEHILNIMHSSFLAAILWASAMPGWGCGIRFSQKAWDNWRELNIRRTFLAALWIPERLSTLLRCREATIRTSDPTSWFQGGIPWFPHVPSSYLRN